MDVNRIFSAEQIAVHPDLPGILKQYTKAAIREKPQDLVKWSVEYFKKEAGVESEGDDPKDAERRRLKALFNTYDSDGSGQMDKNELAMFVKNGIFIYYCCRDDSLVQSNPFLCCLTRRPCSVLAPL